MAINRAKYARRRLANTVTMSLCWGSAALGLSVLVIILSTLVIKGTLGLSPTVFTEMTPPPGGEGGLLNAIAGSLVMSIIGVARRHADRHSCRHLHGRVRTPQPLVVGRSLHQ